MDAIAEVHDKAELDRALALDCRLIGINNRDLKTFAHHAGDDGAAGPRACRRTAPSIAESGIASHADLQRLAKAGVHAFLVGESLMRQPDVAAATRGAAGSGASWPRPCTSPPPIPAPSQAGCRGETGI